VLYVDAGRVLTSAGAAAGLDLCLHPVRKDFGAAAAARSAREAVMPLERSGGQAQFIEHAPPEEDGMGALLGWLERHVAGDLSLESIERVAEAVGFRSATVLRQRFARVVGTSPLQYRRAFRSRPA
jgi:transcriptional regulator GlxA family with amidase domain